MQRIIACLLIVISTQVTATDINSLETYVSRVGKLIEIVADRPNLDYSFVVSKDNDPYVHLSKEQGLIEISYGLLGQLRDEAELAATLALAIGRLADFINLDRESAKYIAFAGYDPQALLDIQKQFFHAVNADREHWLSSIYGKPLSAGTISANRVMIKKLPKGLQRGAEEYYKQFSD